MKGIFYFLLYLIYFTTPFESVAILPGFSVVKLVTLLFFITAFVSNKFVKIPVNSFVIYYFLYTVLILLSTVWSIDTLNTLVYALTTIIPSFLLVVIVLKSIETQNQLNRVFMFYSAGSAFLAFYVLFLIFTGFDFTESGNGNGERVTIFGQDQNELSFLLTFGIVTIIYLIKNVPVKKIFKIFLWGVILVLSYVVLSTGSRTGFVILLTIIIIVSRMYAKGLKVLVLIPVFIGLGLYLFTFLPESIMERLFETSTQLEGGNLTNRGKIWSMGLIAFLDTESYLFGIGFKSFKVMMTNAYNWPVAGHNTYLITLVELGLVGFSIFMGMIVILVRKVIFLVRKDSAFYLLLLLPLLLAMLTLGTENRRWMFLIAVLILKLAEFKENQIRSVNVIIN